MRPSLAGPSRERSSPMQRARCAAPSKSLPLASFVGAGVNATLPPGASKLPVSAISVAMARSVWVALVCWHTPAQQ